MTAQHWLLLIAFTWAALASFVACVYAVENADLAKRERERNKQARDTLRHALGEPIAELTKENR